jgi:tetratricopeptide (TPR) repeat protein
MHTLKIPLFLCALFLTGCSTWWEGIQSNATNALVAHAKQLLQHSDYDSALAEINAAVALAPQNPDLYILRGQVYLNLYEWDKSLNDFSAAIELAPEYADAYFQRGVLYYSILQTGQELREEALADFQHYLELAPDGEHADQAREYAAKIEAELATLNE